MIEQPADIRRDEGQQRRDVWGITAPSSLGATAGYAGSFEK
jgi:hypothetical protein